uniref:Uncharacterized protein n=1 Tax=Arundo donax TaxID=35708 RepID=A0A0A9BWR1_ARUDO
MQFPAAYTGSKIKKLIPDMPLKMASRGLKF